MIRPFRPRLFPPRIRISVHEACADAETGLAAFADLEVPKAHRTG
jgi:hypothetical protein